MGSSPDQISIVENISIRTASGVQTVEGFREAWLWLRSLCQWTPEEPWCAVTPKIRDGFVALEPDTSLGCCSEVISP